ncbi:hypothetical protein GALMADRAFT_248628 [Galerina marginata CBS 339.88]|uniref:Uncharacterized protein n=1 Tax=Galerina marginata (strain CBS 339.88) TaxID=685588 RepID=A0A067T7J2_GALM3|nr:hypothetical protein GALMADRAFT_248628 [Galerina marginata CBS 339.88]
MTYADVFRRHQELAQAHLVGKLENSSSLLPSFFPPASYWTSSEKDLFFHGLTVHSRLRPDLIAEHIKTKSTFDVCVYLDALESSALREATDTKATDRRITEPAVEVSERWIQCEEELARALSEVDVCRWSFDSAEKDAVRAPSRSASVSDEQHVESFGSNFRERTDQEYWGLLDSTCLVVLENIIREAETEDVGAKQLSSGQAGPCEGTLPEVQESGVSEYADQPSSYRDKATTEMPSEKSVGDTFHLASKHEIRRRVRKRLYMRRKRAEQAGKPVIPNAVKLRPGRLKRLRKPPKPRPATYNTKKKLALRADFEDDRVSSDTNVTATPTTRSDSVDSDDDERLTYEPHSQGGATKPYRVKKFFQEHGVDAQALVCMNLDFFHLSTLARLLRLYTSIHEPTVDVDHVSISADTIQLLVSITTEFVSEVVRRSIITKEQEIRQKRGLKVWKYDQDEITAENMSECLNSMGLSHLDKVKYIARFLGQEGNEKQTVSVRKTNVGAEGDNHQPGVSQQPAQPLRFSLPQSLLWCSLPTRRQLFSTDDPLSEEIHQTELQTELEHEEKLNMEDAKISEEFERSLWDWQANDLQASS